MKICIKCNQEKPYQDYYKSKVNKDGLDKYCNICRKEKYASYNYNRKSYHGSYIRKDKNSSTRKLYIKNYNKEYRNNAERIILHRVRSSIRRSILYKSKNTKTQLYNLIGWTGQDFIDRYGEIDYNSHLDHIVPVSWFLPDSPIDIINSLDNLQITTKEYNLQKHNYFADPISLEFYLRIIYFIKPQYIKSLKVIEDPSLVSLV